MADTLVLNADGLPVSYLPLSTIQWKEAVTNLWLDKVNVLEWYDDWIVRSSSWETRVPAVVMMKQMMRRKHLPRFTKSNLFLRDMYTCQYCNRPNLVKADITLDHVTPISKGGKTSWNNIVAACKPCNSKKGNLMLMKPLSQPYQPTYYQLVNNRKKLGLGDVRHPSWLQFISY